MKLCIDCLQELFDSDNFCNKCNSDNLINDIEIKKIKNILINTSKRKRRKLIKDKKYNCIYSYMITKVEGERFWNDVDNKSKSYEIIRIKSVSTPNLTIICPYCSSTNTKKISGLSKAGSVALFGIFAMGKVSKQWHCNNCDSDF